MVQAKARVINIYLSGIKVMRPPYAQNGRPCPPPSPLLSTASSDLPLAPPPPARSPHPRASTPFSAHQCLQGNPTKRSRDFFPGIVRRLVPQVGQGRRRVRHLQGCQSGCMTDSSTKTAKKVAEQ